MFLVPYIATMVDLFNYEAVRGVVSAPFTIKDLIMFILLTPFFLSMGLYYFAIHGWLEVYYVSMGIITYIAYRKWWRKRE